MEINCPNCGELNVDTKFCINCGRNLTESSTSDFTSDFSEREEKINSLTQSYENNVRPPSQIIGNDEKFCIVCGQTIKISASTCTYCGATVEPVKNKQEWKNHGIILREEGKGLGLQSLAMGLIGLFCCHLILGPLAIIMGYRALQYESEKSLGNMGIILGIIDIVIVIVVLILKNIH
ncbi:MAG: zinc ribbon domain-containing protein [Candidatus Eremiobacterota bacterium]